MKKLKFIFSCILSGVLIFSQAAVAFASPDTENGKLITGTVQQIVLEADASTGLTMVHVTLVNEKGDLLVLRMALEIASGLGLVTLDGDGNPVINDAALGQQIEVDPVTVLPEEKPHPVGNALSVFFADIEGLEYTAIMQAHDLGNGFGIIAQALWLTRKLDGDAGVFLAILTAKKDNDFSGFTLEDGSSPTSWGQLKKAILDGGKNGKPGVVPPQKEKNGNGNGDGNGNSNGNGHGKDKGKEKDKSNNGGGNGNGKKP